MESLPCHADAAIFGASYLSVDANISDQFSSSVLVRMHQGIKPDLFAKALTSYYLLGETYTDLRPVMAMADYYQTQYFSTEALVR